jgi:hypothetical protein
MVSPATGAGPARRVRCGMCTISFVPDEAQPACKSCPLSGSCRFVRCPRCGFENPEAPRWLERLVGRFAETRRDTETR